MQKLHYSVYIEAPKEKVWQVMLDDQTYREWTSAFMPGSYYEGSWTEGSKMRFVSPGADGTLSGMSSEIKEIRPYEFVSIRNLGEIITGEEKPFTTDLTDGAELLENYTFSQKDGGTELQIDLDSPDEYVEMFNKMWPDALAKLKSVVESK